MLIGHCVAKVHTYDEDCQRAGKEYFFAVFERCSDMLTVSGFPLSPSQLLIEKI